VTITGTAPTADNTQVVLFAGGAPATPNAPGEVVSTTPALNGSFNLKYTVNASVTLAVNFTYGATNSYTAACPTTGGEAVVRVPVSAGGASNTPGTPAAPAAAALAFTGSSDTPSFVLIGIAAVVVGAVLVVAARRRRSLR